MNFRTSPVEPPDTAMNKEPDVRWPAEWEPQDAVWLSWPHRRDLWQGGLDELQQTYGSVAAAIAPHALVCVNAAAPLHPGVRQAMLAAGMSEEQIAAAVQSNKDMIELIRLILPGSLIVCSPIIAFANYMGSRKVLSKMGVAFAPLPPFKNWRVSEYLIWPFALSMGFMATYPDAPKLAFEIAINIQTVTSVAFLFQGWAVIYWWLEKNGKPLWLGAVSVVLALSVQLVSTFIVLLGAFESVFDNRNLKERSL